VAQCRNRGRPTLTARLLRVSSAASAELLPVIPTFTQIWTVCSRSHLQRALFCSRAFRLAFVFLVLALPISGATIGYPQGASWIVALWRDVLSIAAKAVLASVLSALGYLMMRNAKLRSYGAAPYTALYQARITRLEPQPTNADRGRVLLHFASVSPSIDAGTADVVDLDFVRQSRGKQHKSANFPDLSFESRFQMLSSATQTQLQASARASRSDGDEECIDRFESFVSMSEVEAQRLQSAVMHSGSELDAFLIATSSKQDFERVERVSDAYVPALDVFVGAYPYLRRNTMRRLCWYAASLSRVKLTHAS